jgi:hypothetical protein
VKKENTLVQITYQVLDEAGRVIDVVKERGRNKNYIKWRTERLLSSKYGRGKKFVLREIKKELIPV